MPSGLSGIRFYGHQPMRINALVRELLLGLCQGLFRLRATKLQPIGFRLPIMLGTGLGFAGFREGEDGGQGGSTCNQKIQGADNVAVQSGYVAGDWTKRVLIDREHFRQRYMEVLVIDIDWNKQSRHGGLPCEAQYGSNETGLEHRKIIPLQHNQIRRTCR
jgi:hypothetical protein